MLVVIQGRQLYFHHIHRFSPHTSGVGVSRTRNLHVQGVFPARKLDIPDRIYESLRWFGLALEHDNLFRYRLGTAVIVRLAGTDGAGCLHRGDEDPSVAHAAGPSGNFDSLDQIIDAVVIHDHPDPALSGRLPLDQI